MRTPTWTTLGRFARVRVTRSIISAKPIKISPWSILEGPSFPRLTNKTATPCGLNGLHINDKQGSAIRTILTHGSTGALGWYELSDDPRTEFGASIAGRSASRDLRR